MDIDNSCYAILRDTIEQGLEPVASYIEKAVKRSVYIVDYLGHICHPLHQDYNILSKKLTGLLLNCYYMDVPQKYLEDGEYYYLEETQYFCYANGSESRRAYIIIKNLPVKALPYTLSVIGDVQLALKYYFFSLDKVLQHVNIFKRDIVNFFLKKDSIGLTPFFRFCDTNLDQRRRYYVSITHIIDRGERVSREQINSFSQQYFNKVRSLMISAVDENDLYLIIPEVNIEDSLKPDKTWPEFDKVNLFVENLEKRFSVITSTGIGGIYSLLDLDKSYREARIALTIPKLMGKTRFVQNFSELGIFSIIFADIDNYKEFSLQYLDQLIQYDEKNGTELIFTLQSLISNNYNLKATADNLYIYVNTLQRRIRKISEILQTDFMKNQNRYNIYTSVLVYSTLKNNSWL